MRAGADEDHPIMGGQTVQTVRLCSLRPKDSMVVQVAWRDVTLISSGRVDDVASMNMIENWITPKGASGSCSNASAGACAAANVAHPSRALAFSQTSVSQPAVHHANR